MQPHVAALLKASLPWLSPEGQELLEALAWGHQRPITSAWLQERLGLTSRRQLAGLLEREGLPTLRELVGWSSVLGWALEWEWKKTPLGQMALRYGRLPGVYYRTVYRVTGLPWRELQLRGSAWVVMELLDRCRKPGEGRQREAERAS